MIRGQVPVPAKLKLLRGNPGKQVIRPEAEAPILTEMPSAPAWLEAIGREEWNRVVGLLLEMQILSSVDLQPLAAYCQAVETWRKAVAAWNADGRVMVHRGSGEDTIEIVNPLIALE